MGFLIFAFRKLTLRRQISNIQFKLMNMGIDKQRLMEQSNQMQSSIDMFGSLMQQAYGTPIMNYQMQMQSAIANQMSAGGGQTNPSDMIQQYMRPYQELTQAYMQQKSIFDIQQKAAMQQIHSKETQMDQEMDRLNSQLKLMQEEMQNVEKGEDQEAKQAAPKFGLS